ncbi:pentapeptide repeat-containing protein [Lacisediminihabitans profunda]|uniref:Pentapeptide repeat-containing protein n=1 Tax=Lacisediminihabitans profunda TaxID=2594790 RepID=A0A5C8UIS7_9MICO|nr:pentapeptide repeat-containing protein [Lacisediminihabitans profunda]TXN28129.1 pentapeptide repeat-containing protein [Lacisediminihabitans profunda]
MAKLTTLSPKIERLVLVDLTDGDPDILEARESYDGLRFLSADLSGRDLAAASFSDCEFLDLSANGCDLRSASFVETRIERLDAPILAAPRSRFRDVVLQGSRIGSAEFYDASWQSVHISNCKLGFVNLRGAELRDVLFTDCTIDELDLGGAAAHRMSFVNTTVTSLDVTRAKLEHVDLRGAELRGLTGIEGLRGATVNPYQVADLATVFARHFGIKIEE